MPFLCLVYGGGWVSEFFVEEFEKRGLAFKRGISRVDDEVALREEITALKPSHVLGCMGRTHGPDVPNIDWLETRLSINLRDNLQAPLNLALLAEELGFHYTYIGTGCIFEFDAAHEEFDQTTGFKESDRPNFFGSGYSKVKGVTDRLLHLFEGKPVFNVRIRMPISRKDSPRNFISKIASYPKLVNIQNSMTVLDDIAPAIVDLMLKGQTGTLNATNSGTISHNEIMQLYKEFVDPAKTWENFSVEEQNKILASGRSNNRLDTSLLEQLCPQVPDIHTAVKQAIRNWVPLK
jgi:dTDP-4-dehydrorhamnose reductase